MKCTTYARALTVAIAATVGFAAAAAAAPPDHYFCYQAKDSKSPAVQPKFPKEFVPQTAVKDVQLIDQFGTRFYDIVKYTNFCNPTEKTYNAQSFPPAFPAVHLAETQIKLNKNPANTKFVKTTLTAFDQFFSGQQLQLTAPAWLRVRASKVDGGALQKCKEDADCTDVGETCQNKVCLPNPFNPPASPPANNVGIDNFVCYKAKQLAKQPVVQAEFEDQFNPGAPRLYDIKKLTKFCVPADKNGENPGAESNPGHLTCYQAKIAKTDPKQSKFPVHTISINTVNFSTRDLQAAKEVEVCLPATATTANAPTMLLTTTEAPGALSPNNPPSGVCGTITPGPVPSRVDPLNPLADPNAACIGAGNPSPCCSGPGAGTCNDGSTITCGSLQFGGGHGDGMPANQHFLQASGEVVSLAGSKTGYNLACTSWSDPACTLSGKPQDAGTSTAGSTAGSSGVTPISSAGPPLATCAIQTLHSLIPGQYASDCRSAGQPYACCTAVNTGPTCDPEPAPSSAISGSVDLSTGAYTLVQETRARVWLFVQCPVCQDGGMNPVVGVGGNWGVGTCAAGPNAGGTCYVRTSDPADAGKSADCPPPGNPSVPDLFIPTTQSTAGASASGPGGLFCPGPPGASQDDNGAGSDVTGCFDSNSRAECTGYSIIGSPAGPLAPNTPKHALTGAAGCIGSVGALLDDATGLPGPVGVSVTTNLTALP